MATKYYLYYVEGEDEKLQRKQRCLTDLIESGFLICETGDDVMKEIKFVTGGWTDYFPLAGGIILIVGGLFVYYRKKRRKM